MKKLFIKILLLFTFPSMLNAAVSDDYMLEPNFSRDGNFTCDGMLGVIHDSGVTFNAQAAIDMDFYIEYGTTTAYGSTVGAASYSAGDIIEQSITGLTADTEYYYRVRYRENGGSTYYTRPGYSFHTRRNVGSSFVFAITSDNHSRDALGEDTPRFEQTLLNIVAADPDFLIDLGDTFVNTGCTSLVDAKAEYTEERPYWDYLTQGVAFFHVTGNHAGEELYDVAGADCSPVWAANARKVYIPGPTAGPKFSATTENTPNVGVLEDYYSFTSGNARIIVLSPFYHTATDPISSEDGWDWSLGETQHAWLKTTLEANTSTWVFIFIHQLVSPGSCTNGGIFYARGGVEAASYTLGAVNGSCEWGGENDDGSDGWAANRNWDGGCIHDLLVANNVTAVFHGHDHHYRWQTLDDIAYVECPRPNIEGNGFQTCYSVGTGYPSAGFIKISVSSTAVQIDYIRTAITGDSYDNNSIVEGHIIQ